VAYNLSGDYRTIEEAVTMLERWYPAAESEACQGELPSSVFEFVAPTSGQNRDR
jgi:hypothetical protein